MAFHYNSHHGHTHPKPCCCCCCCCSSSCCQPTPHPAIHSATRATAANDPLLQAIAARLFHSPTAAPPPQPGYHLYNQAYPVPQHLHPQQQQQQQQQQQHQKKQREHKHEQQVHQPQAQSLIESLLGRIAALETALPHLSPPPPPPAAMPDPPPRKPQPAPPAPPAKPRLSIRDLAARTIQAHFRLYLVRRSQALRHLKHLAAVRSHVVAIKSSLSDQTRLNPEALSQQASDLLLQLDSIQNTDPTIREGKRSISRELVQLLELAEGLCAKRHERFTEPIEIVHKGIDPLPFPCPEESSPGVEEGTGVSTIYGEDDEASDAGSPGVRNPPSKPGSPGVRNPPSKPGKRVSFTDRAYASRVSTSARSPFADVNAEWGGGGDGRSGHASDEERSPMSRQKPGAVRPVTNGSLMEQKGSRLLGLAAPMPVQMEPRRSDPKSKHSFPV